MPALTWTLVFLTLKKDYGPQPEIKVHLEIRFIFRSILFDFQSFTEKPVFECPFDHPVIIFLSSGYKQHLSHLGYKQISYGMDRT